MARRHGVIPAGAGNMPLPRVAFGVTWGHPRRRGEHRSRCGGAPHIRGSSPQARGTLTESTAYAALAGVIPAGAGNIASVLIDRRAGWGHPRRRGEHRSGDNRQPGTRGSSPQARGTLKRRGFLGFPRGVIPAGAGNIPHQTSP